MASCDCFSGSPAIDANPRGKIKTLFGLSVYQTHARNARNSKGRILLLPDAFGLASHNQVLADNFAASGNMNHLDGHQDLHRLTIRRLKGFDVLILDYFQGGALPEIYMRYRPGTNLEECGEFTEAEKDVIRNVDMTQWLQGLNLDKIQTLIVAFVEKLKYSLPDHEQLHVVGHCFGGIQAFQLACHPFATSVVVMHPGPCDVAVVKQIAVPVFVGLAESDVFDPAAPETIPKAFCGVGVYYRITIYGGTKHGFASRASPRDEIASKAYIASVKDTVSWFEQAGKA